MVQTDPPPCQRSRTYTPYPDPPSWAVSRALLGLPQPPPLPPRPDPQPEALRELAEDLWPHLAERVLDCLAEELPAVIAHYMGRKSR